LNYPVALWQKSLLRLIRAGFVHAVSTIYCTQQARQSPNLRANHLVCQRARTRNVVIMAANTTSGEGRDEIKTEWRFPSAHVCLDFLKPRRSDATGANQLSKCHHLSSSLKSYSRGASNTSVSTRHAEKRRIVSSAESSSMATVMLWTTDSSSSRDALGVSAIVDTDKNDIDRFICIQCWS